MEREGQEKRQNVTRGKTALVQTHPTGAPSVTTDLLTLASWERSAGEENGWLPQEFGPYSVVTSLHGAMRTSVLHKRTEG